MLPNGYTEQRETGEQRFSRFLDEFRRRHDIARREKYTGELSLTLGLLEGNAVRREIHTKDVSK